MNSFIRGLGGGIGRVFGRIIALIIVGVLGYFVLHSLDFDLWDYIGKRILFLDAKAQTQNRDMGNMIYSGSFTPCGLSYNKYCAQTSTSQTLTRSLNTTYNGVLLDITFSWQETSSYQTTITINGMSTDFRNNHFTCNVWGSTQQDSYGTLMSSASCSFISKSKIQVVIPQNSYSYHTIHIWGSPLTGVSNYGIKSIIETWDDGQQDLSSITDNASQNTQDIIENANNNTQDIINKIGGLFKSDCYENMFNLNAYSNTNGNLIKQGSINGFKIPAYIYNAASGVKLQDFCPSCVAGETYYLSGTSTSFNSRYIYVGEVWNYGSSKTLTDTMLNTSVNFYGNYQMSGAEGYVALGNIAIFKGTANKEWVPYGEESCKNKLDEEVWWQKEIKDSQDETNRLISSDNVDSGTGADFFNDFENEDFGLSSIITLPLTTIQSLSSSQCVPLELPIPFTNGSSITLPCMAEIYQSKASGIYNLWQIVCYGLIGYWIGTDIFHMVKGFKDPDTDKVEVVDL